MIVQSMVKPKEIEIDEYSVWINENISEISVADENGTHTEYEYKQTQYSKDAYIGLMDEKNKSLENELTDTQLAICELYETIGG